MPAGVDFPIKAGEAYLVYMKLTSLIPSVASSKINEELSKNGIDFDVNSIKAEDLEQLVDAMKDLEIDVEGGSEGKVKVYFE